MRNKENASSASDEDAEATAAASRQESTRMIRSHLDAHLALNPNSSYVSWIATLHPENAHVTIDPRFFTPDNPWKTVYEEGRATTTHHVTGVPVANNGESESEQASNTAAPSETPRKHGGLFACVFGFTIALIAVLCAFILETTSAPFYLVAVGFHKICHCCKLNVLTFLPLSIFWIMLQVFLWTDILLLWVNVLLVELLAVTNAMICTLFSLDCGVGKAWHQHTRRLAHYTRWAFRMPFQEWKNPPRSNCCPVATANEEEVEDAVNVVMVRECCITDRHDGADAIHQDSIPSVPATAPTEDEEEHVVVIPQDSIVILDDEDQEKDVEYK